MEDYLIEFTLLVGLPRRAWKLKQQAGRVGRDGTPAMDITLVFPQKGMNETI